MVLVGFALLTFFGNREIQQKRLAAENQDNAALEENAPLKNELATEADLKGIDTALDCQTPDSNRIVGQIFTMINEDRKKENLKPYKWDSRLCESAKLKNQDMLQNNYFEHTSPTFVTFWSWLGKAGYRYSLAGENLVMNILTAPQIHQALMESNGHRANILSDTFEEVGLALAVGLIDGKDALVLTEHFAKPLGDEEFVSKSNFICSTEDVKKAEKNLEDIKKDEKKIKRYLENAEEKKDEYEEAGADTEDIREYVKTLEKEQEKLDGYKEQLEKFLEQCLPR